MEAHHRFVDDWAETGLDFVRAEAAGEAARASVAALIGADASDVALIASVSAAAGLVAAQFGPAAPGQSVVIGEREYSSNHYPWRLLEGKGYDVRQVAFRNGGLEPDDVARHVDGGTVLVAFSAVQTATGHRSDIASISAIAHAAGATVFVDGSQLVGGMPVADDLGGIDVLATADHKFLMHAGRGLGYCYLAPSVRDRFVPINAGWKAGRVPLESFFGPDMDSPGPRRGSTTPSAGWLRWAIKPPCRSSRCSSPTRLRTQPRAGRLAARRGGRGRVGADRPTRAQPEQHRVGAPGRADPAPVLAHLREHGVVAAARDGNLRLSVHLYVHEDDIERLIRALPPR